MNILKKYAIAHKGLGIGRHELSFDADDRFFEQFEGTDIRGGRVHVDVDLEKQGNTLILDFSITGSVKVECDRCLDEVELPIAIESRLHVRFAETEAESDGDIMWVSPAETEIPLAQYIYETIYLSLPYQRVHPDGENGESTCNKEMLSRFKLVDELEFEKLTQPEASPHENPGWSGKLEELKAKMESEKLQKK